MQISFIGISKLVFGFLVIHGIILNINIWLAMECKGDLYKIRCYTKLKL